MRIAGVPDRFTASCKARQASARSRTSSPLPITLPLRAEPFRSIRRFYYICDCVILLESRINQYMLHYTRFYSGLEKHMLENPHKYSYTTEQHPVLERIAETLDCSVSDFSEPTSSNLNQTAELLCMWLMIGNEQDRLKVLAIVRSIAPTVATQQHSRNSRIIA